MKKGKSRLAALALTGILCFAGFADFMPITAQAQESAVSGTVIDVTDYGAQANNGYDNAEAIAKAIQAAKEASKNGGGKHVTISFPKGRYDIYPDKIEARELHISNTVGTGSDHMKYKDKKIGILLEDMDNVTIDGNGSLFMFHGKMTTFASINCKNVEFKNFDVDFQTPTVIDLTVESRNADNSVTVYVPECYNYKLTGTNSIQWLSDVSPYTNQPYWTENNKLPYTQRFDTKTGLTYRSSTGTNYLFENLASIEDLGNNRLKFKFNGAPNEELQAGLCYQMRQTIRDHAGAFFWKSENVKLTSLDIHFLHGFGMVGQNTDTLTLNDVDFEAPLESGRTTAGYADFIQMSGCKGVIDISGCTFSNPHDDPINIHGTFNEVVEVGSDNKTFVVQFMHHETSGFPNFFEGDTVEFASKSTLLPVQNGTAKVVKVEGPDGEGGTTLEGGDLSKIKITLDKPISGITANQFVVENVTYTPEVKIHDNIFKETPTRGVLVTTRKPVLIENNLFDGLRMSSIFISDDANDWYESGRTENITIRNNVFTRGKDNAIYVKPEDKHSAAETVHKNLTIEGNTFYMENQKVVNAKSVTDLTIKNNTIYRQDPNVTFKVETGQTNLAVGASTAIKAEATSTQLDTRAFRFENCKNVTIEGNKYDARVNAGAELSGTDPNQITVTEDIVNKNGDHKTEAGTIDYESSNPSVIKVSQTGSIVAVGDGIAYKQIEEIA